MPRKSELRDKFRKYERLTRYRVKNEGAIIEALPAGLDVARITPPKRESSAENGGIEIECLDYTAALGLMKSFPTLLPVKTALVEIERTPGHKTRSFLPVSRIPMRWHNNKGTAVQNVFPVLFQLSQSSDPLRPRVTIEWYAELLWPDLIVNVRAIIQNHPVAWRPDSSVMPHKRTWEWVGTPEAPHCRVMTLKEGAPPFVTLWWDEGFAEEFVRAVRSSEEVAHVKT